MICVFTKQAKQVSAIFAVSFLRSWRLSAPTRYREKMVLHCVFYDHKRLFVCRKSADARRALSWTAGDADTSTHALHIGKTRRQTESGAAFTFRGEKWIEGAR
jgi:hypothetical protein